MIRSMRGLALTFFVLGTTLASSPSTARAYSSYTSSVPNGTCLTCHNNGSGGKGCSSPPCWNTFAPNFVANGRVWNAALAVGDADGDGFTNGRELLDPGGRWVAGTPNPGNGAYATSPGIYNSNMNECAIGRVTVAGVPSDYEWCQQYCQDQDGNNPGYSCSCGSGYTANGTYCIDIDECASGNGGCNANATCTNTTGSRTCACKYGYFGDGFTCVPDCAVGNGGCSGNATCSNAGGGRACTCKAGFSGDGITCTDVDECASIQCPATMTCTNTPGSYQCACAAPSVWDGSKCINPCGTSNGGCLANAWCTNTASGASCACKSGYTGDGRTSCTDVNECSPVNRCCSGDSTLCPTTSCTNTPGSYTCSCPSGTSLVNGTCARPCGVYGITFWYCVANATCGPRQVCYGPLCLPLCTCAAGWEGDGTTTNGGCSDINECTRGTSNCAAQNAFCTNKPGSFACTPCGANAHPVTGACACNTGYAGDPLVGCVDVDECASAMRPCGLDAACVNTTGSYQCTTCDPNATIVGAVGAEACVCNTGYTGTGVSCADVDECATGTHSCSPSADCTNTPGAHSCACKPGFQGTGAECFDIDDCAFGAVPCPATEMCVNQWGAPRTCECLPGFARAGDDPSAACVSSCGNGRRIPAEACDDGNDVAGDGCSPTCRIEPGYACREATRGGTSACMKTCGDGFVDPPFEQCDEGSSNADIADACRTTCVRAACGDGILDRNEVCDDGALNSNTRPDACRSSCVRAFCGDGIVDPARGEQCDHGRGGRLPDEYCTTVSGCERPLPIDGGVGGLSGGSRGGGCGVTARGGAAFDAVSITTWLLLLACVVTRRRRRTPRVQL